MGRRVAVVLFNLGGPDGPDDVRPFLRNLFRDPAIIGLPGLLREPLAWLIARRRAPEAAKNYALMGGGSPLLAATEKQARALETALKKQQPADEFRCFIAMRYWTPFVADAVQAVRDWGTDETVLLPLYPQFSTTTTGSSLAEWRRRGGGAAKTVCCYPLHAGFIAAHAALIRETWEKAGRPANARLLFSAHGLPEKVIRGGDPYQWQVEETAKAIAALLPELADHEICYQSRVGPLKWIGPATDESIIRAARAGKHIILSPVAFVSEHIETLVELDTEYAGLAREHGAPGYHRAPALGTDPGFIAALASAAAAALSGPAIGAQPGGARLCPAAWRRCPRQPEEAA